MQDVWLVGNDNTVILPGLHSVDEERSNPAALTYYKAGLTLSAVLKDEDGDTVATIASGSYISGTDGDWKIVVPSTAPMSAGNLYTLTISLSGDGKVGRWDLTRRAANRTS